MVKPHKIANCASLVLCVMLILFPKGGVRISSIPVTWGYLLLFVSFIVFMPYRLIATHAQYYKRQLAAFACLVPFAFVMLYSAIANGIPNIGGFISTGTSLLFFPILFLWFFPPLLKLVNGWKLMQCVCYCMLAAAIFGVFLFIWRPVTGFWIQIPYLTVNADDVGDFGVTKNIQRGFVFKLISTYNNGNLYGAATFILLKQFDLFTPVRWKRWTMRLALLLTLSRTIWAGLIFDQMLSLGASLWQQRKSFPRLKLGRLATVFGLIVVLAPVLYTLTTFIGLRNGGSFIIDPTLGGRTAQFVNLGASPVFPTFPSEFFFTEIIYLSAINLYGYIGLPVITLVLMSPALVLMLDRTALQDPVRRAALKGLLLYALVATSDGALNYIPVMAFYWFTYMLFIFGLPGVCFNSDGRPVCRQNLEFNGNPVSY